MLLAAGAVGVREGGVFYGGGSYFAKLIIVDCGSESVLPDVLAMHTIEMIPKSMILICVVKFIYISISLLVNYYGVFIIVFQFNFSSETMTNVHGN